MDKDGALGLASPRGDRTIPAGVTVDEVLPSPPTREL